MLVQIVVDRVAPTFLLEEEQAGSVHCVRKPVVKILGLQSVRVLRWKEIRLMQPYIISGHHDTRRPQKEPGWQLYSLGSPLLWCPGTCRIETQRFERVIMCVWMYYSVRLPMRDGWMVCRDRVMISKREHIETSHAPRGLADIELASVHRYLLTAVRLPETHYRCHRCAIASYD